MTFARVSCPRLRFDDFQKGSPKREIGWIQKTRSHFCANAMRNSNAIVLC